MRVGRRRWLVFLSSMCIAASASTARAESILVFAAASLKDALDAAIVAYHDASSNEVAASYAASSTLARQIEQGAEADIYVAADPEWMDYLEERDLVQPGSRLDLLSNRLVLIAPADDEVVVDLENPKGLVEGLGDQRIAMGDPAHVPAGIYGRAALESLGVWADIAPKVAPADNVRAALALVARGETPLGVVYRSDAMAEAEVRVAATFPEDSHPRIVYSLALVADGDHAAAGDFARYLGSPAARPIFERYGFTVLDQRCRN